MVNGQFEMVGKSFLIALGFSPKENTVGVFSKKYPQAKIKIPVFS